MLEIKVYKLSSILLEMTNTKKKSCATSNCKKKVVKKKVQKIKNKTSRKKPKVQTLKNAAYLSLLGNTKQKKRRSLLIDYAGKDDIDAICQCIFNVLGGNVKVSNTTFNRLKKHKKTLRYLVNRRVNDKQRKAVLKQKGGFLPFLIPLAIKLISSFVGR